MKACFVSFQFGEYCIRIASALARHVDTLLLLPEHLAEPYRHLVGPDVKLKCFPEPRLRQLSCQLRTMTALCSCIKRFNPDVIHLQVGHPWFAFALPLLRSYPLILTSHDPIRHVGDETSGHILQLSFDWISRRAKQVIVHNQQMKEVLSSRVGIPQDRVHVVPHVLYGDDTAGQNVQEEDGVILFFGRIWGYKGLDYLVRAEPLITSRVPHAKIVIAGTGEEISAAVQDGRLAHYRRMMTNPDRFIITEESLSVGRVSELFRRASVVVLPYIEASQSAVIPIAYTFSKPVVATRVGGLPSQVDDGSTGILVPPRDERALADAIVRLLSDRNLRHQLGANGNRRSLVEWSPDVIARKTLDVYQLALHVDQPTFAPEQFYDNNIRCKRRPKTP